MYTILIGFNMFDYLIACGCGNFCGCGSRKHNKPSKKTKQLHVRLFNCDLLIFKRN